MLRFLWARFVGGLRIDTIQMFPHVNLNSGRIDVWMQDILQEHLWDLTSPPLSVRPDLSVLPPAEGHVAIHRGIDGGTSVRRSIQASSSGVGCCAAVGCQPEDQQLVLGVGIVLTCFGRARRGGATTCNDVFAGSFVKGSSTLRPRVRVD